MPEEEIKKVITDLINDYGLTTEEVSLVQEDLRKGDREMATQRIAVAQERQRKKIRANRDKFILIVVGCFIGFFAGAFIIDKLIPNFNWSSLKFWIPFPGLAIWGLYHLWRKQH